MRVERAIVLFASALLCACSGMRENPASVEKVGTTAFNSSQGGVVILSTGAAKECVSFAHFLDVRDATEAVVPNAPAISIDAFVMKSEFSDHHGAVNAIALPAGRYYLSPRNANPYVVAKKNLLFPFEVVAGQTTYLGELYMTRSCGTQVQFIVRDQYARDLRMALAKNPVFSQRPVVKHVLMDWNAIAAQAGAAEVAASPATADTPSVSSTAPQVATAQKWEGYMSCNARADSGANAAAFKVRLAMHMTGQQARILRETPDMVESLSGTAGANTLELRGNGHRISDPGRAWQYLFDGQLVPGSQHYEAEGSMSANGKQIRSCRLIMNAAA